MPYQAVLFDLDGTLLDTASDIGATLNQILQNKNLPTVPQEIIRPYAGKGVKALIKLGLNIDETHPEFADISKTFSEYYQAMMLNTTALFDGMEDTLHFLEKNNIPWGIVTNKPKRYTNIISEKLKLNTRTPCIVSGDTLTKSKPHPDPILHACSLLKATPQHCLYVGDSLVDVIASKAAGLDALVALYGYISEEESPKTWNADGYISHPKEILAWLTA